MYTYFSYCIRMCLDIKYANYKCKKKFNENIYMCHHYLNRNNIVRTVESV